MGVTGGNRAAVWDLAVGSYVRHSLHTQERVWPESNCYVDVCIEVLHAAGADPYACLGFTLATEYEGDQFTFFKQPVADIEALYGIQVLELNLWQPLLEHALTQLARGRMLLAEVDAFYLPDTSGTDYRTAHTKTTVGLERIDRAARTLGYFHNAGYHELRDADFDGVFQLDPTVPVTHLPPYVELVKLDRKLELSSEKLVQRSLELTRKHLRRRSPQNPITEFKAQVAQDLAWLITQELGVYHQYAFSTLRQLGASCEFASLYLRWLAERGQGDLQDASDAFSSISTTSKALILKLARAVNGKRMVDLTETLSAMEASWDSGMQAVVARLRP